MLDNGTKKRIDSARDILVGKVTDLTKMKEGQTINMMQMASVVGANIE